MLRALATLPIALLLLGCGSKGSPTVGSTVSSSSSSTTTVKVNRTTTATAAAPGALQVEAAQTAAGDIPDNQVFVSYPGKRFTMKFPEGWVQLGGGATVTFRDKNNIVRVVLGRGPAPTVGSVRKGLTALAGVRISGASSKMRIGGSPAVKTTYVTSSKPSAVTGKRVSLTVDRYVLAKSGTQAVVDLGSPVGVDNVDAYRLMIESFRLR